MGGFGSGGKTKPAETKRALGNPGHRPIPESPAFAAGGLACPKWFTALEKAEWLRIVPELERVGVARGVHQGALEGVCVLYAGWRKAHRDRNWRQARMLFDSYRKGLNDFGLTPASAGRVGGVAPPGVDPAEEFFTGPRIA